MSIISALFGEQAEAYNAACKVKQKSLPEELGNLEKDLIKLREERDHYERTSVYRTSDSLGFPIRNSEYRMKTAWNNGVKFGETSKQVESCRVAIQEKYKELSGYRSDLREKHLHEDGSFGRKISRTAAYCGLI